MWTYAQEGRLIDSVRDRPILWDISRKDFKNREHKEIAWEQVQEIMGVDVECIKMKWKSLKDVFMKNLRKQASTKSNGSGADSIYTPKWKFFNELQFLMKVAPLISGSREHIQASGKEPSARPLISGSFESTPTAITLIEDCEDFTTVNPKVQQFISEVRKHGLLWNKGREKLPIQTIHAWEAVAKQTGLTSAEAKSKWKNLRDIFMRELRNRTAAVVSSNGDVVNAPGVYTGKWAYFEMMSFLAPGFTPLAKVDISPNFLVALTEETPHHRGPNQTIENAGHHRGPNQITEDPTFSQLSQNSARQHRNTEVDPLGEIKEETEDSVYVYSDDAANDDAGNADSVSLPSTSDVHQTPSKRARTQETTISRNDSEDEDMNFFKSLVPYMKKLCDIQKLKVRNEFQSILIREFSNEK